jgi:hypothetical protein
MAMLNPVNMSRPLESDTRADGFNRTGEIDAQNLAPGLKPAE